MDFLSDHFTTYIIKKKNRENNKTVYRTMRDLTNFDAEIFRNLILNESWDNYDYSVNVEEVWFIFYNKMYDILTILCPFKSCKQCEIITPWLTPEIYRMTVKGISLSNSSEIRDYMNT